MTAETSTTGRIIEAGRQLMMMRGYNGFSFADVAEAVSIRKASVHHHFPAKADLAVAFCLAAVLAAEAPSLPPAVAAAVREHFHDLATWLAFVLAEGRLKGVFAFEGSPDREAERFMASIYGAMLAARVFGEPERFKRMARTFVEKLLCDQGVGEAVG